MCSRGLREFVCLCLALPLLKLYLFWFRLGFELDCKSITVDVQLLFLVVEGKWLELVGKGC